jgi:zinc ribbon protein
MLTKCRECGKEISDQATACPHCGAPQKIAPATKKNASSTCLGCVLIVGLLILVGVFLSSGDKSTGGSSTRFEDHPSSGSAHFSRAGGGFIFGTKAAYEEALKLTVNGAAKTHPEMIMALMSCWPQEGESVTVIDFTLAAREIIVDTGRDRGCRGWTAMENVVR